MVVNHACILSSYYEGCSLVGSCLPVIVAKIPVPRGSQIGRSTSRVEDRPYSTCCTLPHFTIITTTVITTCLPNG